MTLVRVLFAFACAATEHLLKQNATIFTGRRNTMNSKSGMSTPVAEHIDGHNYRRLRSVPELPDALEWSVHGGTPGDFGDEAFAATEDVACEVNELVSVRCMREVVRRKDERLRESPVAFLVLQAVRLELLQGSSCSSLVP